MGGASEFRGSNGLGGCRVELGFRVLGLWAFGPSHKRLWVLARRPRALHKPCFNKLSTYSESC